MTKVLIICTGGTISMLDVSSELTDCSYVFQDEVKKILPKAPGVPEVEFIIYNPLIDSSEMTVDLWNKIGADIYQHYDEYDGFVVLHGTDTMAYTGAALSYMLENLGKPVILTGAQVPLSKPMNDARENIVAAVYIAALKQINEVCIMFNHKIYRANRVTKFSTDDFDAYMSANFSVLGSICSTVEINSDLLLKSSAQGGLKLVPYAQQDVRVIYFMPHLTPEAFETMIQGAKAVILYSYGDGNIPIQTKKFTGIIEKYRSQGVIFVNKSQCLKSKTTPKYDAGDLLVRIGIVCAGDQTMEAVSCKLMYLLTKGLTQAQVESEMKNSLRGELTLPAKKPAERYSFMMFPGKSEEASSENLEKIDGAKVEKAEVAKIEKADSAKIEKADSVSQETTRPMLRVVVCS